MVFRVSMGRAAERARLAADAIDRPVVQLGHQGEPELLDGARARVIPRQAARGRAVGRRTPSEIAPARAPRAPSGRRGPGRRALRRTTPRAAGSSRAWAGSPPMRGASEAPRGAGRASPRPRRASARGDGEARARRARRSNIGERRADVVRVADHLGRLDEDVAAALDDRVADHQPARRKSRRASGAARRRSGRPRRRRAPRGSNEARTRGSSASLRSFHR